MKEQIKKIDPKLAPTKALHKGAKIPTIGSVIFGSNSVFMKPLYICIYIISMCCIHSFNAQDYHISIDGYDHNVGNKEYPFRTISKAASIALPGDVITVHEGTYRERVNPSHGGLNDQNRIIYQAAEGEEVWIKGSEIVKGWELYEGNVWVVSLNNEMFANFNPYKEILKGDWLMNTYGRDHHLGEVYINGEALYEIDNLKKVLSETPLKRAVDSEASKYKWVCKVDEKTTMLYANFNGLDPNEQVVEINVRPAVFFPKRTGINYITVRGFNMAHAATQWAPPTAHQEGLIGPNWSKGWIIENNLISDSKCTGISLGKESSTGQNEWTNLKVKHGTQRQREVVFDALTKGWSKETIGSHIVRNNTIKNCEQAGICGHLGAIFSEIYNNHIYNIHTKKQFFGYETGGIKLHAAIDTSIEGNLIHNNYRGLWLDWQSQGTQVSKNIFYNNTKEDFFNEVNHGPMVVDNNIFLSKNSIINVSQGTAYLHNLVGGNILMRLAPSRFTPYHFPHSTAVAGLMGINHGDDRFYNNIFSSNTPSKNKHLFTGLNAFDGFPLSDDAWYQDKKRAEDFAALQLPVYIAFNLYYNKALPFEREENNIVDPTHNPTASIEQLGKKFFLKININKSYKKLETKLITTAILGSAFQTETPFENMDGSKMIFNTDFLNNLRSSKSPKAGPFELLTIGENKIEVFDLKNIKH